MAIASGKLLGNKPAHAGAGRRIDGRGPGQGGGDEHVGARDHHEHPVECQVIPPGRSRRALLVGTPQAREVFSPIGRDHQDQE